MEFAFGGGGGLSSAFASAGGQPSSGSAPDQSSPSPHGNQHSAVIQSAINPASLASSISSISSHHHHHQQLHHDLHYQHHDHNHHHHASPGAASALAAGLSHDNGPMIFSEPNRTSAIDDIRSVVIYIFIVTIFLCFFLILPGIRSEKFPTFLCITTSLLVTSIILLSLFGTTWHVADAPISAAYKAFSRDRIQGELSVKIGLQSVNITLRAHKYYILHATDGPIIMENSPPAPMTLMAGGEITAAAAATSTSTNNIINLSAATLTANGDLENLANSAAASSFINQKPPIEEATGTANTNKGATSNLAEELLGGRTSDGIAVDTELETDEVFSDKRDTATTGRWARSSSSNNGKNVAKTQDKQQVTRRAPSRTRRQPEQLPFENSNKPATSPANNNNNNNNKQTKYTIKRVNVDINYNERFYMIGPNQMRQEYHSALERGLPYPILTVVEYLSQDDAGFNWSRQYRAAGYYSSIMLWVSVCACILMFCLHCAAPKYGIYMMQILGCLLLFTDLTYYTLVPKGEQKLVIPFEGQSLSFKFGWSFWLTLVGGCIALVVGTVIVIIDYIFPNYIFTTILDVDFDANQNDYLKRKATTSRSSNNNSNLNERISDGAEQTLSTNDRLMLKQPNIPPFYNDSGSKATSSNGTINGKDYDDDDDDDDYDENDDYFDEDATSTSTGGASGNIPQRITDNHKQLFERNARVNSRIETTFKQRDSFIERNQTNASLVDNHHLGKQSERANNGGSSIVDMAKFDHRDNDISNSTGERLRSRAHHDQSYHHQRSRRSAEAEPDGHSTCSDHQNVRL